MTSKKTVTAKVLWMSDAYQAAVLSRARRCGLLEAGIERIARRELRRVGPSTTYAALLKLLREARKAEPGVDDNG